MCWIPPSPFPSSPMSCYRTCSPSNRWMHWWCCPLAIKMLFRTMLCQYSWPLTSPVPKSNLGGVNESKFLSLWTSVFSCIKCKSKKYTPVARSNILWVGPNKLLRHPGRKNWGHQSDHVLVLAFCILKTIHWKSLIQVLLVIFYVALLTWFISYNLLSSPQSLFQTDL